MSVGANRREVLSIISSGVGIIFGLSNIGNAQEITREGACHRIRPTLLSVWLSF